VGISQVRGSILRLVSLVFVHELLSFDFVLAICLF